MRPNKHRLVVAAVTFSLAIASASLHQPAAQADGTPTITIVAGSGSDGPAVNDQLATSAALWGPSDVAVVGGNAYIADTYNHEMRSIDSTGYIRRSLGDGTPGCDLAHLVQPHGVASDGSGGFYASSTLCQLVLHVGRDGTASQAAGRDINDPRFCSPFSDGAPIADVCLNQPAGLDYGSNGILYLADQFSGRVFAVTNGEVFLVAGTGTNGFNGDGGAQSSQLSYPRDVLYHDGVVYIADSSNGLVRMVSSGNLITLASVSSPSGLAFDSAGNLYIAGGSSGQIWKRDTSGNLSLYATLPGGLGGMDIDAQNNLYVADSEATNQVVYKIAPAIVIPPPPPKLDIAGIQVNPPQSSDLLLTRGLEISAAADDNPIGHFEYGWAPVGDSSGAPTMQTQISTNAHARLNYGVVNPDSDWLLYARAIGLNNEIGPWSNPVKVHTPKAPLLIAIGDSITSGHHNDYGDNGKTTCEDASYGYAGAFSRRWAGALPAQWQPQGQYVNLAFSGFATETHPWASYITGTITMGGKDTCGTSANGSPLLAAEALLARNKNSWNRVVATGGINDTNWSSTVTTLIQFNLLAEQVKGRSMTAKDCGNIVNNNWNGKTAQVQRGITEGISKISSGLTASDPSVKLVWLSYYNAAGTGTNKVRIAPYLPITCEFAFDVALGKVAASIKAGLPQQGSFVDIDAVMREQGTLVQPLFAVQQLTDGKKNPAGWPHPNSNGAIAIASLIDPQ